VQVAVSIGRLLRGVKPDPPERFGAVLQNLNEQTKQQGDYALMVGSVYKNIREADGVIEAYAKWLKKNKKKGER
jgi:hypothetical protein